MDRPDILLLSIDTMRRDAMAPYGRDRRGDELPEALRRREDRLSRLKACKATLEAQKEAAFAAYVATVHLTDRSALRLILGLIGIRSGDASAPGA